MFDNNSVGLAMVMIVPLCFFLVPVSTNRWQEWLLFVVDTSALATTVVTYSRGALLGLAAVAGVSFVKSKEERLFAVIAIVILAVGMQFLPPHRFDRMNTTKTYEEDESANRRLNSWIFSCSLAKDNLLGGGFECFIRERYYKYAPDPDLSGGSTAHNI